MRRSGFIRCLSLLLLLSGFASNLHASMGEHSAATSTGKPSQAKTAHTQFDSAHAHTSHDRHLADDNAPDEHDHNTTPGSGCCDAAICAGTAAVLPTTLTILAPRVHGTSAEQTDLTAGLQHTPLLRPPR